MKAMVYTGRGRFSLEELPEPTVVEPKDAVVRVTTAAICTSDLHIRDGAVPRAVPGIAVGHEFTGVVESIGTEVHGLRIGDRVVANCETFCGECYFCRNRWVNNCTHPLGGWSLGCRIDGGQAELVRVPFADNGLIPIPDDVTDDRALLAGDLLSTGYWANDIGGVEEGDTVAIIGAGPTGLCCAMFARIRGAGCIILVDRDPERLGFAESNGLGDLYVDTNLDDPKEVVSFITAYGADVVMDVAGGEGTFQMAWEVARPNATVVIVAMYGEAQTIPLPDMYGKNLTFKTGGVDGCHCDEIMDLISSGKLDASCLITHSFPLSRIEEAYDLFSEHRDGVMKVAIRMHNEQ